MNLRVSGLLLVALGSAFGVAGCEEKGKLNFEIVMPENYDPFEGVTTVTLRAGDKEKSTTITGAGDAFDLKIDLQLGTSTRLELEGTGSGGELIASGQTPPLYIVGSSQLLRLWVSRVGRLSRHPQRMNAPVGQPATADYLVEDWDDIEDDRLFTFWFGGCDAGGFPLDVAGYFDPFVHEVFELPDMGESEAWTDPAKPVAARCGSTAMGVDDGIFLVFGGTDAMGALTDTLVMVTPQTDGYRYWPVPMECDDGEDNDGDGLTDQDDNDCISDTDLTEGPGRDWARTHAAAATLGPYPSLWDGTDYRVINSFLITGGWSAAGRSEVALHLLSEISSAGFVYRFRMEEVPLLTPRAAHTSAVSLIRDESIELRTVLLYGGTEDATGVAVAESLSFEIDPSHPDINWTWLQKAYTTDDASQPLPRLTGHASIALKDGNILVVGGRDSTGAVTADGWLFNPLTTTFTRIPDLLPEGRAGHSMGRAGYTIIVAGGENPAGETATEAYVLEADTLTGEVSFRLATDMAVPRWGQAVFTLANDQIAVAGGFDDANQPIDIIEIYNPE